MADYDIRPLQLRILKILLAVDKVCKEHGLRYYIMAGTMLVQSVIRDLSLGTMIWISVCRGLIMIC